MAKCMVWKNKKLLSIGDASNRIPVVLAYRNGCLDMTRYLYSVTPREDLMPETGPNGSTIISQCFIDQKYDIAWGLIQRFPRLIISRDHYGVTPLYALSGVPSLNFWQRWIYECIKIQPAPLAGNDIYINVVNMENDEGIQRDFHSVSGVFHMLLTNFLRIFDLDRTKMQKACVYEAIFQAVEQGIPEFLIRIFKTKPELVWSTNEKGRSIFHYSIERRQEKIYSLIYGLPMKDAFATLVDTSNNNMLQMAAMSSPFGQLTRITGAALKMQRELQWFKEVETTVPPQYLESTNLTDYKRPRNLFFVHHKKSVEEGEKWTKDTAGSCSVVGALIVTIMFAAAFTVPGGNNGVTGFPIFVEDKLFSLFIISDAVSLFSSTTSSLLFLEILRSRYAEEDFIVSLPRKILIGLMALFLSIAICNHDASILRCPYRCASRKTVDCVSSYFSCYCSSELIFLHESSTLC
ncbi:ankyrin repeat-containing protein ITN1-like isoform X2 [Rosa rugosa]|uniref:ankyrin repeat-containing protein ITN1-like isoform X2 n=1 Tax=Rosa rugosa TaxID=74645 RepID=UPI002B415E32|nr:ankyrin repeat-containing protein ITN1-like isoform X2 [Rosa rugosa]